MSDETKELLFKDLAMRLPYGVKVLHNEMVLPMGAYPSPVKGQIDIETVSNGGFKPILRPLSDVTNEELELMDLEPEDFIHFVEQVESELLPFHDMMLLYKNHVDVDRLIERGIAVDVNTIETDPYK